LSFIANATTTTLTFSNVDLVGYWGPVIDAVSVVSAANNPSLLRAVSRLRHSAVGNFDIEMPLTGVSGVEDRRARAYNAIFAFGGSVASGDVTVVSGAATVASVTPTGNQLRATLTSVADAQIVILRVSNINGDGLFHGDVPFGFLIGDVDGSRLVDNLDASQVTMNRNQTVNVSNFRDDIDLSGLIDLTDLQGVRTHFGNSLP
jgi:hypothetical protein